MPTKWDKILQNIRLWGTIITGLVCAIGSAVTIADLLGRHIAHKMALLQLGVLLLAYVLLAIVFIFLCCLTASYLLSFSKKIELQKALRLSEAMQTLNAHTHNESLETIRYFGIRIFSTSDKLPYGVSENVTCKELSAFLSFVYFRVDRVNALGSPHYCCDFEQIQGITEANKVIWGEVVEASGDDSVEVAALERKIDDLLEKNKDTTGKFTAASGREGQLKKRLADVESHMAILVELANKVSNDVKPPQSLTEKEIKAKYLAIGKIHGITEVPNAYVDIFRKNMPKEIINWGGAPKQGPSMDDT